MFSTNPFFCAISSAYIDHSNVHTAAVTATPSVDPSTLASLASINSKLTTLAASVNAFT